MVSQIQGYFMQVDAGEFDWFPISFTTDPFPPGTNVWASISLSQAGTQFASTALEPTFSVAYVWAWSTYNPDGSESPEQVGKGFTQNSVGVANCARITFVLAAGKAFATAQINVFRF
jgi:hypothetical protein